MPMKKITVIIACLLLASIFFSANFFVMLNALSFDNEQANNVLAYVLGKEPLAEGFSQKEVSHLADVKDLLSSLSTIFYVSLAIFALSVVYLYMSGRLMESLKKVLFSSSFIAILISVLLFLASKDFAPFFSNFHVLFFPEGSWVFSPGSSLVELFPVEFFRDFFRRLVLGVFSQALAIVLVILSDAKIFSYSKRSEKLKRKS
ncbi:DUF1461 domain-containing protein [Candidatus Woesearchaeota archaeon]|nr:DUF1461 domain-containing protein [Candidatus Woesearchaeota archaeon]